MELLPFVILGVVSTVLIVLGAMVFYEVMGHAWAWLPRMKNHPKLQIVIAIIAIFACHTIAIWLFGLSYYFLVEFVQFGDLHGHDADSIFTYIYFSSVTYSSLGFGDVYPTGHLRMLAAVEGIFGLIMIGWTVAFSYVFAQRYLLLKHDPDHPKRRKD